MADKQLLAYIDAGNTDQAAKVIDSNDLDVNLGDVSGNTPLHWAVSKNNENMVKLLLAYHAEMEVHSKEAVGGVTPLHLAARHNYFAIGQILVGAGANINSVSTSGCTPMHEAAMHGQMHMVNVLIAAGADASIVDKNGFSPNYYAKKGGFFDIAKKLPEVAVDMWEILKSEPDFKKKLEVMKGSGGKKKEGKKDGKKKK